MIGRNPDSGAALLSVQTIPLERSRGNGNREEVGPEIFAADNLCINEPSGTSSAVRRHRARPQPGSFGPPSGFALPTCCSYGAKKYKSLTSYSICFPPWILLEFLILDPCLFLVPCILWPTDMLLLRSKEI